MEEEWATGQAYAKQPDAEPPAFDPVAWAPRRAVFSSCPAQGEESALAGTELMALE